MKGKINSYLYASEGNNMQHRIAVFAVLPELSGSTRTGAVRQRESKSGPSCMSKQKTEGYCLVCVRVCVGGVLYDG